MTHQPKPPQNQEHDHHHQTSAMDDASEKLENLKSLNAMLLKETVERRQQVDSLQHSNGSLQSELTRSESEKNALHAELTRLSDRTVLLELERNLVSVFVSVQVNQQAEVVEKERDGFGREKLESEKRLGSLEREMRDVLREKSEIEKVKSEKESEIGVLKKRLSELVVEIGNEKNVSIRVCRERDAIRAKLEAQVEEAKGLGLKLIETENKVVEIQEEVRKLKVENNALVEEKEERERRIESMKGDKDSIERCLVESNRVIDEMKREIGEMVRDKEEMEQESNVELRKRNELENAVSVLNEMVMSLQKKEERLRKNVVVLEERCFEGVEQQKLKAMEIDALVEEKREREKSFQSLIGEKGLVLKELDQAMNKLDEQKQMLEGMTREKFELEEAKGKGESEIIELQKHVAKFTDTILSLEESCKGQVEKIKQLESEISHCRDVLDRVTTERDKGRRDSEEGKMNAMKLKAKILEMEKNIEETDKAVGEMKGENRNLMGEKKELESLCEVLMKDIGLVESELAKSRKEFNDMQAKVGFADSNSELVLNLLRNTAKLIYASKDEMGDVDQSVMVNEEKGGEEIKPFVAELEAIKKGFKSRESEVEDMKRQVGCLKSSVAEAHKKKGFWALVSSATTILAAALVAYAARAH